MTKINSIYRILTSIPLPYPDPNFRSIPRNAEGYIQHSTPRTNFNPESRSYFGLKPWISSFKKGKSRIPKIILRTPYSRTREDDLTASCLFWTVNLKYGCLKVSHTWALIERRDQYFQLYPIRLVLVVFWVTKGLYQAKKIKKSRCTGQKCESKVREGGGEGKRNIAFPPFLRFLLQVGFCSIFTGLRGLIQRYREIQSHSLSETSG